MKNKLPLSLLRALLIIAGTTISLNALILLSTSNVHVGHFLCLAIGVSLILLGAFIKKLPMWAKALYCVGAICTIVICASLVLYGTNDTALYNEDAVIVLGASIHGQTPGRTLTGRLDMALEYSKTNSEAIIVVSGGKGPQEDITEAEAMAKYLIEHGVEPERIILEKHSTSSRENFAYSKKLLDEHFGSEYSVAFITNEYHVYRAKFTANKAGYDNISYLHSKTPIYLIAPNVIRECLALVKAWIF